METAGTTATSYDLHNQILRAVTYLRPAHTAEMLANRFRLTGEEGAVQTALEELVQRGLLRVSDFGSNWPAIPGYGLTIAGHAHKMAHGL